MKKGFRDMDEKLEQAATYYTQSEVKGMIDHDIDTGDMERAFKAGANWQKEQSPWISVKDNLPPERVNVFFLVEWRGIHKEYHAGWYRNGIWESEQQIYRPNSFLGNVTHWMPIPE